MRLRVFQANDGDCLLLSSEDDRHMLIDGGRSGSYTDNTAKTVSELPKLDVICVSHIDADHITGILKLLETEVDWRIHLHEKDNPPSGRRPMRKPRVARPPEIGEFWHNGFSAQVGDEAGNVRSMLSLVASAQLTLENPDMIPRELYLADLALGEEQAIELSHRISADQLNIPLNQHFNGKLVRGDGRKSKFALGETEITIIGPFADDLEALQTQWRSWVENNEAKLETLREEMGEDASRLGLSEAEQFLQMTRMLAQSADEFGDRDAVSTPNLASIMMLAEERGFTILLTGDGAGQDILRGLKRRRKLDANDQIHVDVLKVQHHGAAANINGDFLRDVIADHYVFCGNGSHTNPEIGVIELIAARRLGIDGAMSNHPNAGDPFTLHFNNVSTQSTTDSRRAHMLALEQRVGELAAASGGQMDFVFNTESFFDLEF